MGLQPHNAELHPTLLGFLYQVCVIGTWCALLSPVRLPGLYSVPEVLRGTALDPASLICWCVNVQPVSTQECLLPVQS